MSDHCEILRIVRHNRYLDLGNGSNKFGNHCPITSLQVTDEKRRYGRSDDIAKE